MELADESTSAQMGPEGAITGKTDLELEGQSIDAPRSGSRLRSWLLEFLQTVMLTVIIFVAVRSVVQNFQIEGPSMQPTLVTGQYLLVNKLAYLQLEGAPLQAAQQVGLFRGSEHGVFLLGGPQRGDIIVFREPVPPYVDLVKRLIALPGDRVEINRGHVYVNGTPLHEDYIQALPSYSLSEQVVPPDRFFVLGDNRPVSSDSHLWGFVPEANVIGKAWIRYWPLDRWGTLGNPLHAAN